MKIINRIVIVIILLLLTFGSIYFWVNCVIQIDEGEFILFEDKKNGVLSILEPGAHFLFQGIFPDRVYLNNYNKNNINIFDLKLKIPLYEHLKNSSLTINITFNIEYSINSSNIKISKSLINKDRDIFRNMILKYMIFDFNNELKEYFNPYYKKNILLNSSDKIIKRVMGKLKIQCSNIGVDIQNYEILESLDIPDTKSLNRELEYIDEIRKIEKNNKKELLISKSKLVKDKKIYSNYFDRLREISNLLKDNPDLIKYIYIDKLADNVKVIYASGKFGIPFAGTREDTSNNDLNNGEVDNLK